MRTCPDGKIGNPIDDCTDPECSEDKKWATGKVCIDNECVDPCNPNPCGNGANCEVTENNVAVCTCPDGMIGDPITQCTDPTPCGTGAECQVSDNNALCSCLDGQIRDPETKCNDPDPCNPTHTQVINL